MRYFQVRSCRLGEAAIHAATLTSSSVVYRFNAESDSESDFRQKTNGEQSRIEVRTRRHYLLDLRGYHHHAVCASSGMYCLDLQIWFSTHNIYNKKQTAI